MPQYAYECDCGATKTFIRPKEPPKEFTPFCVNPSCTIKGFMRRVPSSASSRMVETLDNGLMTRRVERPANAEQLYKDRARDAEAAKNKL